MGVHTSIWQRVLAIMGLIWYHFQDDFFSSWRRGVECVWRDECLFFFSGREDKQ